MFKKGLVLGAIIGLGLLLYHWLESLSREDQDFLTRVFDEVDKMLASRMAEVGATVERVGEEWVISKKT